MKMRLEAKANGKAEVEVKVKIRVGKKVKVKYKVWVDNKSEFLNKHQGKIDCKGECKMEYFPLMPLLITLP